MERFLVRGGLPSAPKSKSKRKAESCSSDSSTTKKKRSKRSYDPKYLAYGFTWTGEEDHPKPQCVLCYKILANESFKPCKLQRHLEGDHPEFKTKSLAFFEKKKNELGGEQRAMKKATTANEKGLHACFLYCCKLDRQDRETPHTCRELLAALYQRCGVCCFWTKYGRSARNNPAVRWHYFKTNWQYGGRC